MIITDIVTNWPAYEKWSLSYFQEKFGPQQIKTDEPNPHTKKKIRIRLGDYLDYFRSNRDEDQIYWFDDEFDITFPDLLSDFSVPSYFETDYLANLPKEHRRPYRWLLVGPPGSYSPFHTDPYRSSAWNALIRGRKRWTLYPYSVFPPSLYKEFTEEGNFDCEAPGDSAILLSFSFYFPFIFLLFLSFSFYCCHFPFIFVISLLFLSFSLKTYSKILVFKSGCIKWFLEEYVNIPESKKPIEVIQEAGELIYVPSGWWHQVLNLTETIAVTQNYINEHNLQVAAAEMRFDNEEFYQVFKESLARQSGCSDWKWPDENYHEFGPFKLDVTS